MTAAVYIQVFLKLLLLLFNHPVLKTHLQSVRRRVCIIFSLLLLLSLLLSSSAAVASSSASFLPKNSGNRYTKRIHNVKNQQRQQQYQNAFIYYNHQNQIILVRKNNNLFHISCRIYNVRCYYHKSQYYYVRDSFDNDSNNNSIDNNKQYLIYLIDDDESVRIAVSQFLISNNYTVQAFDNGRTALDTLYANTDSHEQESTNLNTNTKTQSKAHAIPDLIISDIRMPGYMDGIEIVQEIRSNVVNNNNNNNILQSIPIILLTAKGLVQDRIVGYNTGADVYLTKPFDPNELLVIIQTTIAQRERILLQQQQSQEVLSSSSSTIDVHNMKRDLNEIKQLLIQQQPQSTSTDEYTTIQSTNFDTTNNNKMTIQEQQQQSTGQNDNNNNIVISPNDRKVLELLCDGYMNKEMATQLNVSIRRIEQILTNLYRITHTKNRTELVRYVISNNIILL